MKIRDFSKLGDSTAAQLNAGTIGVQKDKIVHLDPETEILYDSAENIRNGKVVDDSLEGLVELRLTFDNSEQLQPIRVYPLPPEKLDPSKPAMKYGIAFGHRRTLACRLTSADSPEISGKVRKVSATIDVDWLKRGRSYRIRCQLHENTAKLDLNPVEYGQALLDYQRELGKEEGRHVSQRELMIAYGLKEKTVYNLLKAADFHQIAKDVCHRKLLNDLDTMVTFDVICMTNEPLAQAIFESLQKEGAPSNRSLIRQARVMAEDKDYVFDPLTWAWPSSVEHVGVKVAPVEQTAPANNSGQGTPLAPAVQQLNTAVDQGSESNAGAGQTENSEAGQGGAAPNSSTPPNNAPTPTTGPGAEQGGQRSANDEGAGALNGSAGTVPAQQPSTPQVAPAAHAPVAGKGPIIMVEFKMAAEAPKAFTGELLVSKKAKGASHGVVAYLNEGREEQIEVPLKLIDLVSIHHQ